MKKYTTNADLEALLRTAINLKGRSTKDVAVATGIKPNTLYKWKTTNVRLSPEKTDALLSYFIETEPWRLEQAEILLDANIKQ